MPAYARYHTGLLPETERAASEVLSLPIYPEFDQFETVVTHLKEVMVFQQPRR